MRGFSLVELSIVLVILGLLTGGILAGQSLIRASELRAVSTELQRYQAAMSTFRDKYFALPGDMTNAIQFWGAAHATPATCRTTASTTAATCDGNGDGLINTADASVTYSERHRFWQQLANAGLIEGSYTGVAGAAGIQQVIPGTNAPRSKLGNGGYSMVGMGSLTGDANYYDAAYSNAIFFGVGMAANQTTQGVILKPEELWNIDTKMDDGRPGYGTVYSYKPAFMANCATSATASLAEYNLTYASNGCAAVFKSGY